MNRLLPITILLAMLFATNPVFSQDTVAQAQAPAAAAVTADTTHSGLLADVINWYDDNMNYWTACLLMALESSFIPFPSEVVIPPAVFFSLEDENDMMWWLIVLVGTLGALVGAYINYFLALWLGRPIIYKFANSKVGHLLRLSQEKIERAEVYFNEHGAMSTLVGRFIPVIRQLISIPAGMARMNLVPFTIYTAIGALVWNSILALLGYLAHQVGDKEMIFEYSDEISIGILVLLAVVILFFVIRYFIKKRKKAQK